MGGWGEGLKKGAGYWGKVGGDSEKSINKKDKHKNLK